MAIVTKQSSSVFTTIQQAKSIMQKSSGTITATLHASTPVKRIELLKH
ncbi:MAG: hypothetical protein LBB84_10060 [Tannerellaceae bacterium]|nr:hypothetical protein [Tannerellaceae bacterium]